MIFNRQKILLALIELFDGHLKNTDLQKYLFLLTRLEDKKTYHFVPYKYGCFSFHAYDDKRKLISKGLLKDCDEWVLETSKTKYKDMLPFEDNNRLWSIKNDYGQLKGDELVSHVYRQYPYFAINSTIAKRVLSQNELKEVEKCRPTKKGVTLYTIGYENRSLEEFLNMLLQQNIKLLCDVRKNAFSRKYGFSKKTLQNALESLGIEYKHVPELGIVSASRKNLVSKQDYEELFTEYEKTVLADQSSKVKEIHDTLLNKERIALTCFELLPSMCHRTRIAKSVLAIADNKVVFEEL